MKRKGDLLDEISLYNVIREEIQGNHVLMHWFSLIVLILLLIGIWLVERRESVLSVFLPLLSVAWAASLVRFDFFIHRQGAYLRELEAHIAGKNPSLPLWESWKIGLKATNYIMPVADGLAFLVIVIPTLYVLYGPCKAYFQHRDWNGGSLYAWSITIILILLLSSLIIIPKISSLR